MARSCVGKLRTKLSRRRFRMLKRLVLFTAAILLLCQTIARADERPTYKGALSTSEQQFVKSIQADLMKRFATARDAERAGYFRYTNPDDTGSISYANLHWDSADPQHPSQLWYDKNGKLMGADYSVLDTGNRRPNRFGVNPGRWYQFEDHVHYVLTDPKTGKQQYDLYIMAPKYRASGGNPSAPTAKELVRMHKASSTAAVAHVFD